MTWQSLSPEQARQHPRYGVGGWLYAFFALVVFALIADTVEWLQYGAGSDRPQWLLGIALVVHTAMLVAGFLKWRHFPELAIAGIWLTGALGQIFTEHAQTPAGPGDELDPRQVAIVGFVVFSLALTWLLWSSERVNVTYKSRCRRR